MLLGIVAIGLVYAIISLELKKQRSHTNADIPQSTIDWFEGLKIDRTDISGIYDTIKRNPDDWTKYEGVDSMLFIEDEYFVIYYSAKDSVAEHNKALVCQRYAHEAIPNAKLFMKSYPCPDSLNGRRLPIYLAKTVEDFRNICIQLGHGGPETWAIGMYCFRFGGPKVYTDGIIVSPEAWSESDNQIENSTKDKNFKRVLWHEMNHFIYFTNWDYTQTATPKLWFTEGLAEYFAGNYDRLIEVGDYNKLNLTEDFRGGGNIEYWAGLSAYLCLEKLFSIASVSDVVFNSYKQSIDESVKMILPNYSLTAWNNDWQAFMQNEVYRKYME